MVEHEELLDYARANAWRAPESLRFALKGDVRVTERTIELEAELFNDSDAPVEVIMSAALLHLDLVGVAKRPTGRPPPCPPPPILFRLPPHAREPFSAMLQLADYDYASGTSAEVAWSFVYWTSPYPTGRARVVLP